MLFLSRKIHTLWLKAQICGTKFPISHFTISRRSAVVICVQSRHVSTVTHSCWHTFLFLQGSQGDIAYTKNEGVAFNGVLYNNTCVFVTSLCDGAFMWCTIYCVHTRCTVVVHPHRLPLVCSLTILVLNENFAQVQSEYYCLQHYVQLWFIRQSLSIVCKVMCSQISVCTHLYTSNVMGMLIIVLIIVHNT